MLLEFHKKWPGATSCVYWINPTYIATVYSTYEWIHIVMMSGKEYAVSDSDPSVVERINAALARPEGVRGVQ